MASFPILDFPVEGLRWWPTFANISGGPALTGPGQVAEISGGGWWMAEMDGLDLGDEAAIRQWRAVMMRAAQGVEAFVLEMLNWPLAPTVGGVPHSDSAPFADSAEYATGAIVAELAASAALRATTVEITVDPATASTLYGGEVFTIVHPTMRERIYLIDEVLGRVGDTYEVTIGPPLREAAAAETEVDFNRPRCLMRVKDADKGAWPRITAGWSARVQSITFEEAFDNIDGA